VKKFLKKFTKIWDFMPNTVFDDRPHNETKTFKFPQSFNGKNIIRHLSPKTVKNKI